MKQLITQTQSYLDKSSEFPKIHGIIQLWELTMKEIQEADPDNYSKSEDWINEIGTYIVKFSEVDPGSASFRYPFDKNGRPSLDNLSHISIQRLAEVVDKISELLEALSCQIDYLKEMKSEYLYLMQYTYGDYWLGYE